MESFSTEIVGDVLTETINVPRATSEIAEEFKQRLLKHIEEGWKNLVVDLSKCNFVDSTFLSSLVVALKAANKSGGTLKLAAMNSEANSIIEHTGMSKVFELFQSREEAISSFRMSA